MKLLKRIASRILSRELKSLEERTREAEERLLGRRSHFVSTRMAKSIISCLPDPNKAANDKGEGYPNSLGEVFTEDVDGTVKYRKCQVEAVTIMNGEWGAKIRIDGYALDIFIPLRKEEAVVRHMQSEIVVTSYVWDFYGAGLRVLSDEAWYNVLNFSKACGNVFNELKQEGLL